MNTNLRAVNMGGIVVLSLFAAIWGVLGLLLAGAPILIWAVPPALSVGAIAAGARLSRGNLPMPIEEQQRLGRLIGKWSGIEGLAIFVGIAVLIILHHPDRIVAMISGIVGLHFFPLARGIPLPVYNRTGLAMTLLGVTGLLLGGVVVPAIVAGGGALILWGTLAGILWPQRAAA